MPRTHETVSAQNSLTSSRLINYTQFAIAVMLTIVTAFTERVVIGGLPYLSSAKAKLGRKMGAKPHPFLCITSEIVKVNVADTSGQPLRTRSRFEHTSSMFKLIFCASLVPKNQQSGPNREEAMNLAPLRQRHAFGLFLAVAVMLLMGLTATIAQTQGG